TNIAGVYRVRTSTADRLFAVNPAIDGESDLRTGGGTAAAAPVILPPDSSNGVPTMRLLLLVAAVLVIVTWFVDRRRPVWRTAIAACLAAGAVGLAVVPQAASLDVIAVLDRSRSVPADAQQAALARVRAAASTLRRGDRVGVVGVGAEALVESPLADPAAPSSAAAPVVDTDTDIAAGLRLARSLLPQRGPRRIVLFSDGRQTLGNAEREAAFLAAEKLPVDVSPIDTSAEIGTPAIAQVVAPSFARTNDPFSVAVEISGSPDSRAELTLFRDEQLLGTRDVRLPQAGTATEIFADKEPSGIHTFRATLNTDRSAEAGAVVSVSGESKVLYVSQSPGIIEPVLASAGFQVTHVAPGSLPRSSSALLPYDAVVLDDVSADELGANSASDVAQYVERLGGGLLLLGSSRTLDIGGYPISPLGPSLPVDFRRRSGQRAPAFGLVLIFDKSGSMADEAGGASKIELARQAVMRVLDVLPPTDSLGVIAFDAQPVEVAPLAPGQNAADVARHLQAIVPGGATRIAPAASLAVRWLNEPNVRATVSRRQILLLSDGQTSSGDAEQLRAAVAAAGIEVSTVAIGTNSNRPLLQQLASSTGGRAYFPSDLADLPKIVAREAARSRSGGVVEESFTLRGAASHPVLAGIERGALPRLSGYVVGAARPTAVSVLASHLDDPILCAWQYGLGRVAVFTGDLTSSWSASLRGWHDFGRLWVQSTRWLSRSLDDRQLRLSTTREAHALRFVVDAEREDGTPIDLVGTRATLRWPNGRTGDVTFDEAAPGRYTARVDAVLPGGYALSFDARDRDNGESEHHLVTGFFRGDDQERAAIGPDDGLLRRIADGTGGRVLSASENPFAVTRPVTYRDISAWLAVIAFAMYLADLLFVPWMAAKFLPGSGRRTRRSVQNREAA
ncbi:MAG TPA: VWA domain-containing protein, partial [Vicinamibacterales bacterium]|nr:VWA domain-containing protein [Vicinamibacterales bacterium]